MEELDNRYFNHGNMKEVNISSEMRDNFLSYSMSVIIDRALPDVRDGLKPVHRRVLWAMYTIGNTPDKPHIKSANIVGEVLGKYHPHGDTAAYETMVRMAQDFSYRYPLVDGHGNFGSIDGDEAAAMRYTEARMSKISMEMVADIRKNTIDFKDNYDARFDEPVVMPSRFPNLLVNGSMGIAVGMATNMPPHNLGETIEAIKAVMDDPDISVVDLMEKYLPGPDFPTGGYIIGRSGIRQAYENGRGSVIVRGKVEVEDISGSKQRIVIREIPYLVNKAVMFEKIAALARDKQIEGIADMKDLSNDRNGIRIEIELKKDVQSEVVLNQLYRLTPLQSSFGINNNVLVENTPMLLGVKQLISYYIDHQVDVIKRRTKYELDRSLERAHILEGLRIAIDNIDRIIYIITHSKENDEALARLKEEFKLSDIQAKAIMDMQLKRLTGLERDKIVNELNQLYETINDLKDILANHSRVVQIIKDELDVIKEKYNDKRRTQIIDGDVDVEDEDLIPENDVIISLSTGGYIKRVLASDYRIQNRGGKGAKGMSLHDDDIIEQNITMSTHDHLLLFTDKGKVYRIKGYKVPESSKTAKGIPVINLINIEKGEKVKALVPIKKDSAVEGYLFFVTQAGLCKRVAASEFESIRNNGKIAISLKEDDALITVFPTNGNNEIIIGASNGKAVRFKEDSIRDMGRSAAGVKGMTLDEGIRVIGACSNEAGSKILVVSENGYGKLSCLDEYRMTSRGAKGVKTININERNGELVALKAVNGDEDCMIMRNDGITIRIHIADIATQGRATQGVILIKTTDNTYVSTVTVLEHQEKDKEESGV